MALTRDEYKTQVEPICKKNSEANDKILKTVRKEVKENKLKTAGAKFLKASSALKTTYNELKAVEQPAEDAAKLTKWLGYVKTEADLFKSGGNALKAGNKQKAQKFVNKLNAERQQGQRRQSSRSTSATASSNRPNTPERGLCAVSAQHWP